MRERQRNPLPFVIGAGLGLGIVSWLLRRNRLRSRVGIFTDRVVLITGASRGIGKALACAFAGRGARLALAARNREQLEVTASECRAIAGGAEVLTIAADVTDRDQLESLVAATLDRFGRIDILINNAGIVQGGPFAEVDFEVVKRQIEVNLLAALRLTQMVLPTMIRQGGGWIVNVSSFMGRHAVPYFLAYSVSKAGLIRFGEGLRRELAGTGVCILTANLGFTATQMVSEESAALLRPFGVRVMPVERVARRILDALALGQTEVSIGGVELLAEGISWIMPRLADLMWERLAPAEFKEVASRQRTE